MLVPELEKPVDEEIFTREESTAIKELAWNDYQNKTYRENQLLPLAVIFMLDTGVRRGEVAAVKYEDISDNKIKIRRYYDWYEKTVCDGTKGTYGERNIILIAEAVKVIEIARQHQREAGVNDNEYIFSMNEKPLDYSAIWKIFNKYCKKLGITHKSPHKARKTVSTAVLEEGGGSEFARNLLGHNDVKTTLTDYLFDRKTDKEKLAIMEKALSG